MSQMSQDYDMDKYLQLVPYLTKILQSPKKKFVTSEKYSNNNYLNYQYENNSGNLMDSDLNKILKSFYNENDNSNCTLIGKNWTYFNKKIKINHQKNNNNNNSIEFDINNDKNTIYSNNIMIGRDNDKLNHLSTLKNNIQIDLGPIKSISRKHTIIKFNSSLNSWQCEILSRNGCKINNTKFNKNDLIDLKNGDLLEFANSIQFLFIINWKDFFISLNNNNLIIDKLFDYYYHYNNNNGNNNNGNNNTAIYTTSITNTHCLILDDLINQKLTILKTDNKDNTNEINELLNNENNNNNNENENRNTQNNDTNNLSENSPISSLIPSNETELNTFTKNNEITSGNNNAMITEKQSNFNQHTNDNTNENKNENAKLKEKNSEKSSFNEKLHSIVTKSNFYGTSENSNVNEEEQEEQSNISKEKNDNDLVSRTNSLENIKQPNNIISNQTSENEENEENNMLDDNANSNISEKFNKSKGFIERMNAKLSEKQEELKRKRKLNSKEVGNIKHTNKLTNTDKSNKDKRPTISYVTLIAKSILDSSNGYLNLREIYHAICEGYPYYKNLESTNWHNSVRHYLSANDAFQNIQVANKGSCWTIREAVIDEFLKSWYKGRVITNNNKKINVSILKELKLTMTKKSFIPGQKKPEYYQ